MTSKPARQHRNDIQALRGFAVLVVVCYHAKLGFASAGYLGVDVFFVISGFLITRLVADAVDAGTFRFPDFYFRRAKRLLPAAYVTFLATALLAPFFLASAEMDDFRTQMAGAVSFTANFVLWKQAGYFGGEAELKPLLHVWSLAIEEQYYFVLPALLVVAPRRYRLGGALLVLGASLALCFAARGTDASFYLLPHRAWELAIGSVGALLPAGRAIERATKLAFWPALALMLVLPVARVTAVHPGPEALAVCLATLVLILRRHPLLARSVPARAFGKVGDVSYALYLVHWPLFAFFNNAWMGEPGVEQPLETRLGLMLLSLLLAYLLHRHVEEPLRRAEIERPTGALVRAVAASLGLVALTGGIAHATVDAKDYAYVRRANYGFDAACTFKRALFSPLPECRNAERPDVLVWGDSHAMHLVPGLAAPREGAPSIAQATRSGCGPLLDVAAVPTKRGSDPNSAENCLRFNDSVLDYLRQADSVRTVVLSSVLHPFVAGGAPLMTRSADGGKHLVDPGLDETVKGLKRTIDALRAMGKRVVFIAPPPTSGFDSARCLERLERSLPLAGAAAECRISVDAYRQARERVLALLAALPAGAGIDVIDFDRYLCDADFCRTYIDGIFVFRDPGHLSHDGSVHLAQALSLPERVERLAR